MASDTVPAAVPGPNDGPATVPAAERPAQGLFASMVAPVDPARPVFDLTPKGPATAADVPAHGASSAEFHADTDGPQAATSGAKGQQEKSIWRAWLLAGAERWKKGAGANVKRLELQKAQAQARQVKETRQVSVNRGGGLLGKGGGSSGAGGKSPASKNGSGGAVKGPKNSAPKNSGGSAHGTSGKSGSGSRSGPQGGMGRGPAGGSAGGKGAGHGPKTTGGASDGSRTPKAPKPLKPSKSPKSPTGPKNSTSGTGPKAGQGGGKGPAGAAGKEAPGTGARTGLFGRKDRKAPGGKDDLGSKNTKTPGTPDSSSSKAPKQPTRKQPDGTSGKQAAPKTGPGTGAAPGKKSAGATGGQKDTKQGAGKDPKSPQQVGKKDQPKAKPDLTKATTAPQRGKPFSLRESRETGYRDGTRAARTVAHVKAYRDGVQDGYGDTTQAAEREKARLDKAHQVRKTDRDQQRQEKPVTGTASSADYHQPQPIEVTGVTATHVLLGQGAARPALTRGEVRSLKGFERRLRDKAQTMTQVAEATKGLHAHAQQQAAKATQLLEAAKAVKGGEKLAAALVKLQEAAQVQAAKAEQIHKRAVRAAEACTVILANVETRYGQIYKAVVDSDETAPAKMDFYGETANA